jgi:hypothetical protein
MELIASLVELLLEAASTMGAAALAAAAVVAFASSATASINDDTLIASLAP